MLASLHMCTVLPEPMMFARVSMGDMSCAAICNKLPQFVINKFITNCGVITNCVVTMGQEETLVKELDV